MVFPPGRIASSRFLLFWISSGATVVFLEKFDEDLYLYSIEKYSMNLLTLPTLLGQKLVSEDFADKYDFSSLKITGGAAFGENISKAIVKKCNVIFREIK
jgi:acyl-CoA synthetase (AMP-forming)/AMP-acid ligase II